MTINMCEGEGEQEVENREVRERVLSQPKQELCQISIIGKESKEVKMRFQGSGRKKLGVESDGWTQSMSSLVKGTR